MFTLSSDIHLDSQGLGLRKKEIKTWTRGWKMGFNLLAKFFPLPGSLC